MDVDPNTPSGSRWEPGAATATVPPPAQPVPAGRTPRRLTGPVVAGALGLAVLTGAGGFALGHAVAGDGASEVRQDSGRLPGEGQLPGGRQLPGEGRGDGRFGTPPDGTQGDLPGQDGQGT
ncbi:hypothetical protein [Lentzea sp. NPDC092896]|uniref:hypothetical protein n=1 Tax=Lentzea sp. NPDC092896 TaxID=3364127 RepID=UPI003809366E